MLKVSILFVEIQRSRRGIHDFFHDLDRRSRNDMREKSWRRVQSISKMYEGSDILD
jgi:hypothetical protein